MWTGCGQVDGRMSDSGQTVVTIAQPAPVAQVN